MTTTLRRLATSMGLATAALPLLVGAAHAQEPDDTDSGDATTGYPSTQSPTQAADATGATAENANESFADGADGAERPDGSYGDGRPEGVDGTDTEFPDPDPRFGEGPLGGLLNGPLD